MKTTYNWLKEYVDIKVSPARLADLLTMSGSTVVEIKKKDSDSVFEFEIMSNRPDCLSTVGIAREIAVLTGKKIKPPFINIPKIKSGTKEEIDVKILDKNLCCRYTGRIMRNARVKPSPEWLRLRILSIDLRPVNNVVDITNFCLFELGQPLHAFDLDKVSGDVCVRQAKKGEKITTIDGIERGLESGMLVIADDTGPIAIAGIMGGLHTEVGQDTKNILLESAYFDPVSVRRTSRKLALSSPSSYRFERGVDKGMVLPASNRVASLISDLTGAEVGKLIDVGSKSVPTVKIKFGIEKSNAVLGVRIKEDMAKKIFRGLGLGIKKNGKSLQVSVPSFRNDLRREIDLTEEVARIYGYDRIPLTIPRIAGNIRTKDGMQVLKDKIREILSGSGLNEIVTHNLINREAVSGLGITEENLAAIKNPLSKEQDILAPALLPGMLSIISYNINRKQKDLLFFEIAKLYAREVNASYKEENALSIGITGNVFDNWSIGSKKSDFFYLKGLVWNLLGELGVKGIRATPEITASPAIAGLSSDCFTYIVLPNGKKIGFMEKVNQEQNCKFDIEQEIFFAQISLKKILGAVETEHKFKPLSRYPSVERDISMVADKKVLSDEIIELIESKGEGLIKKVSVFDVYKGWEIPKDKRALSIRIEYRDDAKTLKDEAVSRLHEEVKKALTEGLGISFR